MEISGVYNMNDGRNIPSCLRAVLTTDMTLSNIMRFLTPHDCIEFLISNRFLHDSYLPWWILVCWLKLENHFLANRTSNFETPNKLVSHTIRNLGYACNQCFTPLDGANGFFAFTSHCTQCSTSIFHQSQAQYVDSTIRFYLCGSDSVITKGRAYISHPYWLTTDNSYESVIEKYGSSFQLASIMFDEKNFFDKYATFIDRPRDDKPMSLRRMLEVHRTNIAAQKINSSSTSSASDEMVITNHVKYDLHSSSNSNSNSSFSDEDTPPWVDFLPESLKFVYQEQKNSLTCNLEPPSSLGTMPLKELVKTMHLRKFGNLTL